MTDMRRLLEAVTKYQLSAETSSLMYSDQQPRLQGLSYSDLDVLSESAGSDYSKFHKNLTKNLNLPQWANTLDLFGVYRRSITEQKTHVKNPSYLEQQLFDEFSDRSDNTVSSAAIGDKVALLQLSTLNVPGHKVIARLNGFLAPKEIVKISNKDSVQQLEFADGSKYPDSDNHDVFHLAQTWNMTKLFADKNSASKAYSFYGLVSKKLSHDVEFDLQIDLSDMDESKFSFANPKQKPGDQVRGTEKAKPNKSGKHPFQGRLVGAGESILKELEQTLQHPKSKSARSLMQEYRDFLNEYGGVSGYGSAPQSPQGTTGSQNDPKQQQAQKDLKTMTKTLQAVKPAVASQGGTDLNAQKAVGALTKVDANPSTKLGAAEAGQMAQFAGPLANILKNPGTAGQFKQLMNKAGTMNQAQQQQLAKQTQAQKPGTNPSVQQQQSQRTAGQK
jgi:hypothetical protein